MAKVAFIGLGVMGYPMARHLAKKGGHDLTVYNRTAGEGRRNGWRSMAAGVADDAARGGRGRRVRLLLRRQRRRPALGRARRDGALAGMQAGAIYIDNTTASAAVARELARRGRRSAASASSTRRSPAARPARRTARSRSWSAASRRPSTRRSR